MCKFSLTREAGVNAQNNFGYTTLHKASRNGHEDMVKLLFEKGTDVHLRDIMEVPVWMLHVRKCIIVHLLKERGYASCVGRHESLKETIQLKKRIEKIETITKD